MRSAIALLVLAATLVVAAPASAYDQPVLDGAKAIADAAWPGSPCQGRMQVDDQKPLQNPGAVGEADVRLDADGHIVADPDYCSVRIRPDLTPEQLCFVLVHEAGHLAGHEHDEHGQVIPDSPGYVAACEGPPPVAEGRLSPRATAQEVAGRPCKLVRGGRHRIYRCGRRRVAVVLRRDGTMTALRL